MFYSLSVAVNLSLSKLWPPLLQLQTLLRRNSLNFMIASYLTWNISCKMLCHLIIECWEERQLSASVWLAWQLERKRLVGKKHEWLDFLRGRGWVSYLLLCLLRMERSHETIHNTEIECKKWLTSSAGLHGKEKEGAASKPAGNHVPLCEIKIIDHYYSSSKQLHIIFIIKRKW